MRDTNDHVVYMLHHDIMYVSFQNMTLSTISAYFFFQAEDGIRDLVRSRGLGDVYKRQPVTSPT